MVITSDPQEQQQDTRKLARGHLVWGFPKIRGAILWGPTNQDYTVVGSILRSPCLGEEPFCDMHKATIFLLMALRSCKL